MATFRKRKNRSDVQIRRSVYPLICKTFFHKTDAQKWAVERERQVEVGEYAPADLANINTLGALLAQYSAAISIKERGLEAETLRLTKMQRHTWRTVFNLCLIHISEPTRPY